ncbi:MAG: fibronectin type III domain-containing protein [Fimbriimonadaceae bacterium]
MPDIFKATDAQLVSAGTNLVTVATGNTVALGLTPADITAVTAANTAYGTDYNQMIVARDAAKATTQGKDTAKANFLAIVRGLANRIYANQSVSDELIALLGLPVHSGTRTPVVPVPPSDLVAKGYDNGDTKLVWKSNGNKRSVAYQVEQRIGEEGEWTPVTPALTKTRVTLQDQTPGQTKFFRIRATRNELVSGPSNTAVVYEQGGGSVQLEIAA